MTNQTKNVPELRFPEFDGEWENLTLSQVIEVNSGRDYKHLQKGEYPVYGTGGYMLSVSDYLYDSEAIGIGRKGTINKPYLLKGPFWTVDTLFYCTPKENNSIKFLLNLFRTINWKMYDESTGVPSLSKVTINKINKNVPQYAEQQKIGEFFSKLDRQIELEEQKLAKLEEQKKGYMQKIFSQELRFKDEKGNDYPEWKTKKLDELGEFNSGVGFPEKYQGGNTGVPFFKVSDMNLLGNEKFMNTANNYVSIEQIKQKKWKVIQSVPAIIFAKVGAAIMLNRKRMILNPFLIDNNTMSYSFFNHWDTNFGYVVFQMLNLPKYAQVGALPSYNSKDIGIIQIRLPIKEEQEKIGDFFSKLDEHIDKQSQKIDRLKLRKQGFLQKMFI
ncbi:restriction endonuclease subunit S [Mammaliicoccus sciuri]|uniref:restriction endonuclease subunit S n=1 Tax=Mammaliicoccus sciuri TaxID=1296 RepID=UPI00289D6296|nr:restriction endonuclease subunit S [Mammaliicoccus sciuri]